MLLTYIIFVFTFLVSVHIPEHMAQADETGPIECYTCTNCQLPIDDNTPTMRNCYRCEMTVMFTGDRMVTNVTTRCIPRDQDTQGRQQTECAAGYTMKPSGGEVTACCGWNKCNIVGGVRRNSVPSSPYLLILFASCLLYTHF
ncbi:hypothetical protein CSKR_202250 [Clonorchis sinensis]|uniref:UPAR/Ly6 domain-containing protein n=1 Tax=Clonorchis sinensis TaxID=79923 RepID=A0A8T1LY18_CLOSI|nr:hypothetical protein CSKR_202250 [Clonorchis sinensis]